MLFSSLQLIVNFEPMNPRHVIEKLKNGELPPTYEMIQIVEKAWQIFMSEPTLLQITAPVTIIGDLHGQFYDLLEIFEISGEPGPTKYMFLGDYVDRGEHSIEVIVLLLCYKILYPNRVHLIRGNHEDAKVCSNYGFCLEIFQKISDYPREFWRAMIDCFEALPLAAVIKVQTFQAFCVHGGLSPALHKLSQIEAIPRYSEFPEMQQCIFSDLLWSDPIASNPKGDLQIFQRSSRGAGTGFGLLPVMKFCHQNDVQHIFRSHQMQRDGYMLMFKDMLSTVWSAPNYTKRQNLASVCRLHETGQRDYIVFECGQDFDNRQNGLQCFVFGGYTI